MKLNVSTSADKRYKNPVKCPKCGRVLGEVSRVEGIAELTYRCSRCGDISVICGDTAGK